MSAALAILVGLLSLCPAIVTVDGTITPCLIPLLLAAGLLVVAVKLPPGEAQHMAAVVSRPIVIAAAFPAVFMIFQLLPLPFLANPVWASLSAGFPHGITGSVSIDIGATVIALVRYLSALGAIVLAAAVAINRDRAESVLIGTAAAAALISFFALFDELFAFGFLAMRDEALDCACLGVTLSAACALLVLERHESRRSKSGQTQTKFLLASLASLAAFLICVGAVAATRSGSLAFAAASGFLTFCAAVAIRRWNLGRVGATAIGATAAVIAAALMTAAASGQDPRFAFANIDPAGVELTQRLLNDAPFFGDGAGNSSALIPIYQPGNSGSSTAGIVTAAAKISIEMGKAALWLFVAAAAFSVFALLRGASRRGRDWFYAAAAGACVVTLMNLAFVNTGLSGVAIASLSSVIFGLGLIQSKGRVAS
ncbi:MAG TPA: hypothetical protein VIF02_06750 [Methylocella sp.]